jgi:hypothetical protein
MVTIRTGGAPWQWWLMDEVGTVSVNVRFVPQTTGCETPSGFAAQAPCEANGSLQVARRCLGQVFCRLTRPRYDANSSDSQASGVPSLLIACTAMTG